MEQAIEKIFNKIKTRDESFQIYTYDNGYLIEVSGRNHEDDWATAKVFVDTVSEVQTVVEAVLTQIEIR